MSKKIIIISVLLVLSLALNIFLIVTNILTLNGNFISREYLRFVKPLDSEPLDSKIDSDSNLIIQYSGLRDILEGEIEKYNATGDVGIFLQDTKTGAWSGINEKQGFAPASLLKIPIVMAILKEVDRGEITLKEEVVISQSDLDESYGDLYREGAGAKVSIIKLLKIMVMNSDNTAKNVLLNQMSMKDVDAVFTHIGIPNPYISSEVGLISPRDYMRLFKSLYYSTYLSPKMSELALDLTSDTEEENLISKGVPPEIQVAHKFGMFGEKGLHDCGIVYHKKNPYFLCIMTWIRAEDALELIPKLSKDVYNFIDDKS